MCEAGMGQVVYLCLFFYTFISSSSTFLMYDLAKFTLPDGTHKQNPRVIGGHHIHCECRKCNNTAW